jgi:transcriptional regulator with XRE-family HTH domain
MKPEDRVTRQVGAALRRIRQERDFAMKVVAIRAGVTIPMLSRYELGRHQPTLTTLVKILRVLDCSAEEFGKRLGPWGCLHDASEARG